MKKWIGKGKMVRENEERCRDGRAGSVKIDMVCERRRRKVIASATCCVEYQTETRRKS